MPSSSRLKKKKTHFSSSSIFSGWRGGAREGLRSSDPPFFFLIPNLIGRIYMMALLARTGRQRQLYENHFRLVAGCIPYRLQPCLEDQGGDVTDRMEVLMISTPNRHDLVFPKGGWENDETVKEAACREALEEAGVRGILSEKELGIWVFRSKSRQNCCGPEGSCKGYIFALEVTEELSCWPEQASHERRWVPAHEAGKLCRYDWMREALGDCIRYLSSKPASLTPPDQLSERPCCLVSPGGLLESVVDAACC